MKIKFSILLLLLSIPGYAQNLNKENKLIGTKWVNNLFENCSDTLTVISDAKMTFYSCEHDRYKEATYSIDSDVISVDLYDYLDDHTTIGLSSKYKMKIDGKKLKYTFISHLYGGKFKEVDKKIYETCGEFIRIK